MKNRIAPRVRYLHWCADQHLNEALAEMELTASQGCAMGFISHQKTPPLAKDFEQAHQVSHACAAGILSRLEKKEFIEFRTDPTDKRCKRIYILPKGEACNQHMHEAMDSIEHRMMADFTPEEQEQFTRLLDRAITNLGGTPRRRHCKEETK